MKDGFVRWVRGRDQMKDAIRRIVESPMLRSDSMMANISPERVKAENQSRSDRAARVAKLDPETCSVVELGAAIGRVGWGVLRCNGCDADCGVGLEHEDILRLGDEPDYEASWINLCPACVGALKGRLSSDG